VRTEEELAMKTIIHVIAPVFIIFAWLLSLPVHATLIGFTVSDAVGDHTIGGSTIDLIELSLTIDNVAGAYSIDYSASNAAPFTGDFILNGNFSNLTTNENFFNSSMISLGATTTDFFSLTGTNSILTNWNAGDEIVYFKQGSFFTNVYTPTSPDKDIVGLVGNSIPSPILSAKLTAISTPEPSILLLLCSGLLGIFVATRRKT
jgi:hypothetical protein